MKIDITGFFLDIARESIDIFKLRYIPEDIADSKIERFFE
jgi:hypothetical protein